MEGTRLAGKIQSWFNKLRNKKNQSRNSAKYHNDTHPRLVDTSYGVHYYKELENEFSDDMYSNLYEGSRANMGVSNKSFEENNSKSNQNINKSNNQQATNNNLQK